jgi:hypothetical protein
MTEIEEPELEIQTNLIQREKIKQRHPLLDGTLKRCLVC